MIAILGASREAWLDWAAVITTLGVITALFSKWGGPQVLRWLGRHALEGVSEAILEPIRPRLDALAAHAATNAEVAAEAVAVAGAAQAIAVASREYLEKIIGQLTPNGGRSIPDKITRIDATVSTLVRRFDGFEVECDRRSGTPCSPPIRD